MDRFTAISCLPLLGVLAGCNPNWEQSATEAPLDSNANTLLTARNDSTAHASGGPNQENSSANGTVVANDATGQGGLKPLESASRSTASDLGRLTPNSSFTGSAAAADAQTTAAHGAPNAAPTKIVQDQTSILNSSFMKLEPLESSDPDSLVEHLRKIDSAIGNLVRAGSSQLLERELYEENGVRLAEMKLQAGERLANNPAASERQREAGVTAQLEALSHLSNLGDAESARRLSSLAQALVLADDPDLARLARVVLIGFELQSLENGVSSDPEALLAQIDELFRSAEDRNFPSFMMLRKAYSTLVQLGFREASSSLKETIMTQFLQSPNAQLRGEAWLFAAQQGQALALYNQAKIGFGTNQFDPSALLSAIRILYEEIPYPATLEQIARAVADFEYGGDIPFSRQVADFVDQELQKLPDDVDPGFTPRLLEQHRSRMKLVGRPLELTSLVDSAGQPLDWQAYAGKTILIDFWSTTCLPCLKELPLIRQAYQDYQERGFDVIAVNMDDSAEDVDEFVRRQNLPWRNYFFSDEQGLDSEFAQRSGLTMIPFTILVTPDGLVERIHVRGAQLSAVLDTILAPEATN